MSRKVYAVVGSRAYGCYDIHFGVCGIFKTLGESREFINQEMDDTLKVCDPNRVKVDKETFTIEYNNVIYNWDINPVYADI